MKRKGGRCGIERRISSIQTSERPNQRNARSNIQI
jgi:hypothetical protein